MPKRMSRKSRKSRKSQRQRGGIAPVTAPATILSPAEQARIFLNPQVDDMSLQHLYPDSRTPLLNTAVRDSMMVPQWQPYRTIPYGIVP